VKRKRYNVMTWDPDLHKWTPQIGLTVPSQNVTKTQARVVLAELRLMGYDCGDDEFDRSAGGCPSVLVEEM
jgi:hypothetical protein